MFNVTANNKWKYYLVLDLVYIGKHHVVIVKWISKLQ